MINVAKLIKNSLTGVYQRDYTDGVINSCVAVAARLHGCAAPTQPHVYLPGNVLRAFCDTPTNEFDIYQLKALIDMSAREDIAILRLDGKHVSEQTIANILAVADKQMKRVVYESVCA